MKKGNEIRVLMVEPHEHPKEFLLENTLQAMQPASTSSTANNAACSNVFFILHCSL